MVEISVPTLLGFKQVGESDFKARRISMFPPSYAQRALARHLKRQALREPKDPDPLPGNPPSEPPPALEMVHTNIQTDMTYCYHECTCHPMATASTSLGGGPPGKKGEKGEKGEKGR